MRNAYKTFIGKVEEKRPRGRPRSRWEDNVTMELGEIGWKGEDWMHRTHDRGQWRDV
jgi:hypothetical protein